MQTQGKGTFEITHEVAALVSKSKVHMGTVAVSIAHTSASLVIYENADPSARVDLHDYFERLVPEEAALYQHSAEGIDDSTSHLRMALTRSNEVIPILEGKLCLSLWQGLYVFEHRRKPHPRTVWVNIMGSVAHE
jgi:secondary thiamine-phosphate synthase enzyme